MKQVEPQKRQRMPVWTLRQALRIAYIAGLEERSRHESGRPLTDAELRSILRRYRGA